MATIRPLRGYRPLPEYASHVASKPYDVLTSDEARQEAVDEPLSFLRIGKPEIDLGPDVDIHSPEVYAKAKENINRFLNEGVFKQDPHPVLYLYNLSKDGHTQDGIVCCVSVEEYVEGVIRKHELTRPDKEDDRTKHIITTNAHTGPIFLTYRENSTVTMVVANVRKETPEYDFTANDGVRHRLWVIEKPELIAELKTEFTKIPRLYVADGHHRAAAAVRACRERTAANPSHTGEEEYNFFLAVLFPHSQVRILDYNRTLKDDRGKNPAALLEELGTTFVVARSTDDVRPTEKHTFGLYMKEQWYTLRLKEEKIPSDVVQRLDVSVLQEFVLKPVFGVQDVRTDPRIDFVGGIRGVKELKKRVDGGDATVAFSLCPTSVEELLTVADAGKIMPPKSTWFEPKLRDGLVIHFLD
ncbi:MAG TPA: DUF1015 family protein [Bacteroidota bacterium]